MPGENQGKTTTEETKSESKAEFDRVHQRAATTEKMRSEDTPPFFSNPEGGGANVSLTSDLTEHAGALQPVWRPDGESRRENPSDLRGERRLDVGEREVKAGGEQPSLR